MLVLHTFKPFRGSLAASCFGAKADALLQMSGLPFEREFPPVQKAPRGKLPVLKDGDELIPDSELIRRHLETAHGVDFDGHVSDADRASGLAVQRMVENHSYFIGGHFRWNQHPDVIREAYFADVPALLRGFVFKMVAKQAAKATKAQGLGRHDDVDLEAFLAADFEALSTVLGGRDWLGGAKPSTHDAAVWGALHTTLCCDLDAPGKRQIESHANLVAYEARFREQVYGADWPAAMIEAA